MERQQGRQDPLQARKLIEGYYLFHIDLYLNEVKDVREYMKSLRSKLDLIEEKE